MTFSFSNNYKLSYLFDALYSFWLYIKHIPLKISLTILMIDMWEDHDFNPMWLSLIKPMWKASVVTKNDIQDFIPQDGDK